MIDKIENSIKMLIKDFHKMKFAYIMEADIQTKLYSELYNDLSINTESLKETAISNQIRNQWRQQNYGSIKSIVLHCEVPFHGKHIDIGIWRESQLDDPGTRSTEPYKHQKVEYAIEIKYNWDSSFTEKLRDGVYEDIKKIVLTIEDKSKPIGFFLCFISRPIPVTEINEEIKKWTEFLKGNKKECINIYKYFLDYEHSLYIINPEIALKLHKSSWQIFEKDGWSPIVTNDNI